MRGVNKCERRGALPIERTVCRSLIVDNEDIHDVQIPSLQKTRDSRIALQNVRVCVNRVEASQRPPGVRCALARAASGQDCSADGNPDQPLQSIGHRVQTFALHGVAVVRRRLSSGTYLVETAPWIVTELRCSLDEPSSPVA
jgi:hypothetical protein